LLGPALTGTTLILTPVAVAGLSPSRTVAPDTKPSDRSNSGPLCPAALGSTLDWRSSWREAGASRYVGRETMLKRAPRRVGGDLAGDGGVGSGPTDEEEQHAGD